MWSWGQEVTEAIHSIKLTDWCFQLSIVGRSPPFLKGPSHFWIWPGYSPIWDRNVVTSVEYPGLCYWVQKFLICIDKEHMQIWKWEAGESGYEDNDCGLWIILQPVHSWSFHIKRPFYDVITEVPKKAKSCRVCPVMWWRRKSLWL